MSRLILIKHSLPEILKEVPASEWTLSTAGRARAVKLAARLKPYRIGAVVTSAEPKALQTAEIVGEVLGVQPSVVNDLHEHDRRLTPFHSEREFKSLIRKLFENPESLVFGAETANQALERFHRAIDLILNANAGKQVAIVSHGTVISLFVSSLTGLKAFPLWKDLGLPSFVVLDLEDKEILDFENVT